MTRKKTREEHVAELALHGRVELVGDYVGGRTKTLYRCLAHGEAHEAWPNNVARGFGLKCCLMATTRREARAKAERARKDYLKKIRGRMEPLEEYAGFFTPILHRCLIHGGANKASPSNAVRHGLHCCWQHGMRAGRESVRLNAAETYDEQLAVHGRVLRLEAYQTARLPILHRCLLHGEEHLSAPHALTKGAGLSCCRGGRESIEAALAGTYRFAKAEATSLYIYELLNHAGHLKPGIAKSHEDRADREYGALVSAWERYHRALVYLPEQVLLKATRLMAHCPSALAGWGGASEVRRIDADALAAMAQELMEEIDACANPWEFAIDHGLLTPAQEKRARVLIQAGVISEAELALVEVAA